MQNMAKNTAMNFIHNWTKKKFFYYLIDIHYSYMLQHKNDNGVPNDLWYFQRRTISPIYFNISICIYNYINFSCNYWITGILLRRECSVFPPLHHHCIHLLPMYFTLHLKLSWIVCTEFEKYKETSTRFNSSWYSS